jgi:hypothetical protein
VPLINRSPNTVIEDVLASAQVSTVASHAAIATAIMDAFAVCQIFVTTPAEREAAANFGTSAPGCSRANDLTYTIEVPDAAGNVVEVLGREHSVLPTHAAYLRYVECHPDKVIVLCKKMRVLERSDRKDGDP